jgi:hypothetical protein
VRCRRRRCDGRLGPRFGGRRRRSCRLLRAGAISGLLPRRSWARLVILGRCRVRLRASYMSGDFVGLRRNEGVQERGQWALSIDEDRRTGHRLDDGSGGFTRITRQAAVGVPAVRRSLRASPARPLRLSARRSHTPFSRSARSFTPVRGGCSETRRRHWRLGGAGAVEPQTTPRSRSPSIVLGMSAGPHYTSLN